MRRSNIHRIPVLVSLVLSLVFSFSVDVKAGGRGKGSGRGSIAGGSVPSGAGLPDLTVTVSCPFKKVYPGQVLEEEIVVVVKNNGSLAAADFLVDVVLSSDLHIPVKLAVPSSIFSEDMLLPGGRRKIVSLAAGASISLKLKGKMKVPEGMSPGLYYLGAVADPGKKIQESDENNNTAHCSVMCKAWKPADIKGVTLSESMSVMGPNVELEMVGDGFGAVQGGKKIRMGTLTVGSVVFWSNGQINFMVPSGSVSYGSHYDIYLQDSNGNRVSNIYDYLLKIFIDGANPASGTPGTKVILYGYRFGSVQGTKKVKFGSLEAEVVLWSDYKIRVKVPPLPAGGVNIYIESNHEVISNQVHFTVN